jgi:hypothetical protein
MSRAGQVQVLQGHDRVGQINLVVGLPVGERDVRRVFGVAGTAGEHKRVPAEKDEKKRHRIDDGQITILIDVARDLVSAGYSGVRHEEPELRANRHIVDGVSRYAVGDIPAARVGVVIGLPEVPPVHGLVNRLPCPVNPLLEKRIPVSGHAGDRDRSVSDPTCDGKIRRIRNRLDEDRIRRLKRPERYFDVQVVANILAQDHRPVIGVLLT